MLYNTILTTISELLDQLLLIINSRELCWLDYSVQYNLLFEYFASSPLLFLLPCFGWRCFHYSLLSSHVRNGLDLLNTKGDLTPIICIFLNKPWLGLKSSYIHNCFGLHWVSVVDECNHFSITQAHCYSQFEAIEMFSNIAQTLKMAKK